MSDLEALRAIKDEAEQVNGIYEIFNEDRRLNRSPAARVEFLTTVRYIERYLRPGARILDIGAGAGEYSLYLAAKGYSVSAVELADANIAAFRRKLTPESGIELAQGNALDLSRYPDGSFDIVLLLGPLYHLHAEADRQQCIREAKRVLRPGGTMFFSFISNDMVILTEFCCSAGYFAGDSYDHESFKVEDFPFVFFTLDQCREMLTRGGVRIMAEIAADGVSEMLAERINALDGADFAQYLRYHYYCCEKPEMLGRSNHLLFIGTKG